MARDKKTSAAGKKKRTSAAPPAKKGAVSGIDINADFVRALGAIAEGKHVFVTGRAGTGKSTFLRHLLGTLPQKVRDHAAVLAPTGVAAVNVGGQTIHSFFGFHPGITVAEIERGSKRPRDPKLYTHLTLLIIDEISMVRADLFDCMDAFLRKHGPTKGAPMGGVQLVVIGDLYQLPPVVTTQERELFRTQYMSPYFFDAHAYATLDVTIIELERIYRQRDPVFVGILNAIRNRSATREHLDALNERVADAEPEEGGYVYLMTTNAAADEVNAEKLAQLEDTPCAYSGELVGNFERGALPAPPELSVAPGAQVMLVNNDQQGRWVNGTMGTVVDVVAVEGEPDRIVVALADGDEVELLPHTWDMFRFVFDETSAAIEAEAVGSYTQYPITLAWAVTIHKSQGKTFDKVVVDMGRGAFAHGQTYVALSRVTSLSGLVLAKPIEERHVLLDWRVPRFLTEHRYRAAAEMMSVADKETLLRTAVADGRSVRMTYLKANDTKSERTIEPFEVGDMEYMGKTFRGVRAYDVLRCGERVFRIDRILHIELAT